MTASAASAPARVNQTDAEWESWAVDRRQQWVRLRDDFRGMVAKFGGIAFVSVFLLVFGPVNVVLTSLVATLLCLCVAMAVWCQIEADDCSGWVDWWRGAPDSVNLTGEA